MLNEISFFLFSHNQCFFCKEIPFKPIKRYLKLYPAQSKRQFLINIIRFKIMLYV